MIFEGSCSNNILPFDKFCNPIRHPITKLSDLIWRFRLHPSSKIPSKISGTNFYLHRNFYTFCSKSNNWISNTSILPHDSTSKSWPKSLQFLIHRLPTIYTTQPSLSEVVSLSLVSHHTKNEFPLGWSFCRCLSFLLDTFWLRFGCTIWKMRQGIWYWIIRFWKKYIELFMKVKTSAEDFSWINTGLPGVLEDAKFSYQIG